MTRGIMDLIQQSNAFGTTGVFLFIFIKLF